jgi:hypothetical protein
LNGWSGSFLPAQFMQTLRTARTAEGEPLVKLDIRIARARIQPPPDSPPDLRWPLLAAGLICGIALALAGWFRRCSRLARYGFAWGGALYALFAGLAGVGMAILWAFTAHRAAWANQNLLLFDPLALLLIVPLLRSARRDARASRFAFALTALMTLAAIAALIINLSGWLPQRNVPWILLGLPVWLGMLHGLRRFGKEHGV